jgi:hypothetical protein
VRFLTDGTAANAEDEAAAAMQQQAALAVIDGLFGWVVTI